MADSVKKIALIGAGYMGQEYAKALRRSSEMRLVGIMSKGGVNAQRIAHEQGIPLVAVTVDELYERTQADGVIVAVPELEAPAVIRSVLEYPWAALVEKPPGYTPEVARSLLHDAQQKERRVFVALNRRFYAGTAAVLEALPDHPGERTVIIQDQEDQCAALEAGFPREVVDRLMYANSIHLIDYALLFCRGAIQDVIRISPLRAYEPCVVQSMVTFSSGDKAIYLGVWQQPGPWSVQVCTPSARFEMRPIEQGGIQKAGQRQLELFPPDERDSWCKPGIFMLVEEFGKALRNESHRLPYFDEGVALMQLIEELFTAR